MGKTDGKSHCHIGRTATDTNQVLVTEARAVNFAWGGVMTLGSPTVSITWIKSSNTHKKVLIFPGRWVMLNLPIHNFQINFIENKLPPLSSHVCFSSASHSAQAPASYGLLSGAHFPHHFMSPLPLHSKTSPKDRLFPLSWFSHLSAHFIPASTPIMQSKWFSLKLMMASMLLEPLSDVSILSVLGLSATFEPMDTSSLPNLALVKHSPGFPPPSSVTPSE